MITMKVMHLLFTMQIDRRINKLKNEIKDAAESRNNTLGLFKDDVVFLENVGHTSQSLLSGDLKEVEEITSKHKVFNIAVRNANIFDSSIKQKRKRIAELKTYEITYSEFRFIVQFFFKKLAETIIKGYVWDNPKIGIFRVVRSNDSLKMVNWQASMENKERILNEGKIPYDKQEYIKAQANGEKYEGIPWLVRYREEALLFKWFPKYKDRQWMKTATRFAFMVTRGVEGIPKRLDAHRKSLSEEEFNNYPLLEEVV